MNTNIVTINKLIKPLTYMVVTGFLLATISACGGGGGGGGPTTPGVSSVNPANGATGVDKTSVVTATFRDGMDEVDLAANIQSEFTLGDISGNSISGVANYDDTLNVANFDPDVNLGVLKTYTATLGAGGAITHSGGTVMPQYSWSFTTAEGSWSTAENLEIDDFISFTDQTVAVGGNGDAMAIWMSLELGAPSTWTVHYSKYSASLASWDTATLPVPSIESYTNEVSQLRVAMDHNGNAMGVWRVDPPGGNLDLVASYYNGTSWDISPTTIDAGGGQASEPQIAFDGSGNAIAVFIHGGSVYANRYSSGIWAGAQEIDAGPDTVYPPQISVFDNGNAIAVWAQYNVAFTRNIIYVTHYDAGSGTWSGATSLQNAAAGSLPQVAVSDSGDAIVVWMQESSPHDTYAAVYDGASWGAPTQLSETESAHIGTIPRVGVDATGNGIAVWRAAPTAGVDRLHYKIYTSGSGWGTAGNIDNGVSDSSELKLVMDDEGHAIAIWKQDTDNITAVASTWANRYRSDTSTWGTPMLLETVDYSDAPTNSVTAPVSFPALGVNKNNGNAFAIWLQDQDGFAINSVWVNHFE